MMQTKERSMLGVARRRGRVLLLGVASLGFAGCSALLEVDNPNNVSQDALNNPTAAPAIVNGAINTTANALSSMWNAYNIISDESFQTGSRDDYRLLDTGEIHNNTIEYSTAAFRQAVRARWMSEQAIKQVSGFHAAGQLLDEQLLVQAYLMGAIIYTSIANVYDDTPISDRTVAGPNLGEANMVQMYDSALKWLDAANALATGTNKANVLGMRARVRFDKALWQKLNPPGTTPAQPLINDAQAVADATAAIALMSGDYIFDLLVDNTNSGDNASGGVGFEMNSRVEHTPDSAALVSIDLTNKKPTAIIAKDPVSGALDPAAVKMIGRFIQADDINNPPFAITSKREMYLILAEAALAASNTTGFDTNINALRAIDSKAAYAGTGPTRLQLLQWERRINLVFQGRRLNDMYRFGIKDPRWISTSVVVRKPGCLLPIPRLEREANSLVEGPVDGSGAVCF
jgi:starch-binding outer membrane protein, SusD/RagB family